MMDTGDLVQEALVKAIPHLATFDIRADQAFEVYLRKMIKNRIIDLARRAHRRPAREELPDDLEAAELSPEHAAADAESLVQYRLALEALRKTDREAVTLRLEEGLDFSEIARRLGKRSPDAARMAVSRSIMRLAMKMDALRKPTAVKRRKIGARR
jgi:RNA polymerase sigma-70 factor (ECF subfamily)